MALSFALPDVITRLKSYWNGGVYNATGNPGGMARGGNQIGNFIGVLRDIGSFGDGVTALVSDATTAATATAADRVQTGQDLSNTRLDVIATAQNVTAAAGEVTKAKTEVTNAKTEVQNAKGEVTNAKAEVANAKAWATTAENTEVAPGLFSALHWAKKALAAAAAFSIPPVSAADALKVLRVKADGSGYMLDAVGEVYRLARTANTAIVKADKGKLVDITSGTFAQTFAAAATLLDGWSCYVRNSGTGDITLDPNGSETIDGLASFVMYPGETRLIQSDGAALRSVLLHPGYKTFTQSADLIWPPGVNGAAVDVCSGQNGGAGGGGGGGGNQTSGGGNATGGGGGGGGGSSAKPAVISNIISKRNPGATSAVIVGAGGTGGAGGDGIGGSGNISSSPGAAGSPGGIGGLSSFEGMISLTNSRLSNAQPGQGGAGSNNGGTANGGVYGNAGASTGDLTATIEGAWVSTARSLPIGAAYYGGNGVAGDGGGGMGGAGGGGAVGGNGGASSAAAGTNGANGVDGTGAGGGGGGGGAAGLGSIGGKGGNGGKGGSGAPGYVTVRFF